MRVLTCIGDANTSETWSGTPYFFLQSAGRAGFLQGGLRNFPQKLWLDRILWNGIELIRSGQRGGYQYTEEFRHKLFDQVGLLTNVTELISHFPLFPPVERLAVPLNFYIDATLLQVFENYGAGEWVGTRVREQALMYEQQQYSAARRIVCMSKWAARSVVEHYGVSAKKIHVIPGGANLESKLEPHYDHRTVSKLKPVRLGFIGKDWKRKNLSLIIAVAELLQARGHEVEVIAAGFDPRIGPKHPLLRSVGFLDKQFRMNDIVALIRSFHFGCLFSHAEAFGISNLECLRLGVPVLTWSRGGLAATLPSGLGSLFRSDSSADEIAHTVESYINDPAKYQRLRQTVAERSTEVSWDTAVIKFLALWEGSNEFEFSRHDSSP